MQGILSLLRRRGSGSSHGISSCPNKCARPILPWYICMLWSLGKSYASRLMGGVAPCDHFLVFGSNQRCSSGSWNWTPWIVRACWFFAYRPANRVVWFAPYCPRIVGRHIRVSVPHALCVMLFGLRSSSVYFRCSFSGVLVSCPACSWDVGLALLYSARCELL